jgi:hypothetical protein
MVLAVNNRTSDQATCRSRPKAFQRDGAARGLRARWLRSQSLTHCQKSKQECRPGQVPSSSCYYDGAAFTTSGWEDATVPRWEELFADLEAQMTSLFAAEAHGELADRTRAEAARLTLRDRLYPAVGSVVRVRCPADLHFTGRLTGVGSEWLLLRDDGARETLISAGAVLSIGGLGRLSSAPGSQGVVESRLGLRHALTGVARDRSVLQVHLVDGSTMDGTIDRVGSNFIEVAVLPAGEIRRRSAVLEARAIAIDAVVAVRRDG